MLGQLNGQDLLKPLFFPTMKWIAGIELVLATAIWGFGFVAVEWALVELHPLWILALRYLLAGAGGILVHLIFFHRQIPIWSTSQLRLAFVPSVLLGLVLLLQTFGMVWTTATNSGFITCLYLLFVPLIDRVFRGKHPPSGAWSCVGLGLVGAFLISGGTFAEPNLGDLLTLACAILAAVHIVWIGDIAPKISHNFHFNTFQTLLFLPILLPALIPLPVPSAPLSTRTWVALLALSLGSSLLGFLIQVRAQKVLSNLAASLIFILESPFSALFAILLLGESMSPLQATGAALMILASLLFSAVSNFRKKAPGSP